MSRAMRRVPSPALTVAFVALIVALGGVAVAAIPGPDGVIHACYADNNAVSQVGAGLAPGTEVVSPKGALRVIDSGESCGAGETPLSFNQTGPAGPAATGSTVPTAYAERTARNVTVGARRTTVFSATLPAGSYEVRGEIHFAQPRSLSADQLASCSVIGPSQRAITDSTVSQTLKAGGGADQATLTIDTVVDQMPQGTVTVVCEDALASTAKVAAHAAAAADSPGVVSGNTVQVPIHVPVNACGNSVSVIGLLDQAPGNACVND
jgi:ChpA-C